jgi:hypothetical protein
MTKQVQLRRGTTDEHALFTGAVGELTIDTDLDVAVVHDGSTVGGNYLVGVAATQSIVNKVSIGIGTTNATSELTVVGSADISGTLEVGQNQTINGNLIVNGQSTFSGLTTTKLTTIGVGATDFVVDGTARITETLSVGNNTIVINGNTNTITAETGIFSNINVTAENIQIASYDKIIPENVSSGSTVIPLNNITSLLVGDLLNVPTKFDHVSIVGFGTTSVSPYFVNNTNISLSTSVSIGSTIIGITTNLGISTSVQNYISISGAFNNVPVVGFGTTSIGSVYVNVITTGVSTSVGIGSTLIPVFNTSGVGTISDYLSISGTFNRVPILGITTVPLPSYYSTTTSTSISTTVSIGSTIIALQNTSGAVANSSYLNISGVFDNVLIVGLTTVPLPQTYSEYTVVSVANTVSAGSTSIVLSSTTGISTFSENAISIPGILNNVRITGINTNTNTVTIGTANTSSSPISVGSTVSISYIISQSSQAVLIGAGNTFNGVISTGTTSGISYLIEPTSSALIIGSGSTSSSPVSFGATVLIESLTTPSSPTVLIGTANTIASSISSGSTTTFSTQSTSRQTVLIGTATTINSSVSAGTSATIVRQEQVQSNLNINNLKSVGITTLEQLILSGLTFPTIDGAKGQVLATDGAGNIGFTTGGGGGGAEVMIRVSSNTGSDDNDGKILPVATIKKATQLASKVGRPTTILVETGEYVEDNPIIVYDEVSIIGDSLRNIVVRPLNAGKDLFKVRNGCYLTGMTFNDYINPISGVPQHTYNYSIAFDDPYDLQISRTGYAATTIYTITNAVYIPSSGITTITTLEEHELYKTNSVRLAGIAWTCGYDETGISTFVYNNTTGISTITLYSTPGNLSIGSELFLFNLPFSCAVQHAGVTTTIFPYVGLGTYGAVYAITGINTASKTITIQGGISTIPHTYVGYSTVGFTTAVYNNVVGVFTGTTSTPHGFRVNDNITLSGLGFTCNSGAGNSAGIFPSGNGPYGYTFKVSAATTSTFTCTVGVSTIVHYYNSGGFAKKVPTIQKVLRYPELNPDGRIDFGVISVGATNQFTARCSTASTFPHYYTQGGTARISKPIINKSPYVQNCSILSFLGGNGILVDGNKIANQNKAIIAELGERPAEGDQPEFGKSMVAATFTMVSFGGIGWRTINDGYAQVVSCFQIFCRYASLTQSGGYLSITNSATNFGAFSLRSTGFSQNSFAFDRGRIAATGTRDGLQTLKVVGLGRTDQDLYVLQFLDNNLVNRTGNFKPVVTSLEFNGGQVNTITNRFNIAGHPFVNLDPVVYLGNENDANPQVISGMVPGNQYYVSYIDASSFQLYQDEGLETLVTIGSTFVGINTLSKNNQEFFVNEVFDTHSSYQRVSFASTSSTLKFVSGRQLTQTVTGGSAVGYALTFNSSTRQLIVSVESVGGTRRFFSATGGSISDHNAVPVAIGVTAVAGITTYKTVEFKLDSTNAGTVIAGISSLPENYYLHFHRPSTINSSGHTWEYSGSGIDYNALPQNGGKGDPATEQISELGGRVYASGTNELGDFKIGNQITAYNRTGNIVFNNKVTIGQLDSIRLSLSGGVAVEEFSTDVNLGESEVGGPQNKRVSTQLAVRSFLGNRLGTFIDKTVSANAVPNAVVQLNSNGQINADLIPPKVVNFNVTSVGTGRTFLANQIPAINILQGDTVVEPDDSYILVNDVLSQYLILDSDTTNYTFSNGNVVTSALAEAVTGVVTAPPRGLAVAIGTAGYADYNYVGYGTTGLVKGVLLGGTITSGGSGYNVAGIYSGVQLNTITGIGTQSRATVTVGAGGSVTAVSIIAGGRYYATGNIVSVAATALGGRTGGADFQFTVNDIETRLYVGLTNNQKFAGSSVLSDYIADSSAVSISTSLTARYEVPFTPTDISVGGQIDFTNDRIVVGVGNSFVNGDPVIYDTNGGNIITVGGLGIINLATYYVKVVGAGTSVELHRNYQLNNLLDLTGSGTGTHKLARAVVNVEEDTIVLVGHGYSTGTPVRVTGSTPVGIDTNSFYYTGSITTNSFTFHETQSDALFSVNGVIFNAVSIASTSTGTMTLTKQNVRYSGTVNTSSTNPSNWSLLARDSIDASNIVSGIISPTRLGTGSANSDTVLSGTSEYRKAVFSVGIGTTQPIGVSSYTSADLAAGGVGVNTYYGKVNLTLTRTSGTLDLYSTLGVSRFKTSTFTVDGDGNVSLKNSLTGDVDAATLGGQTGAYYLSAANHTGSVPVTRGGTGLTGVPAVGAILQGNGSAYNLTTSPVFTGITTFSGGTASSTTTNGQVIITGGLGVSGNINLGGTLNAISKSFLIDHPTKPGYKLQYGSLEGPENGVYVRGKIVGSDTIELPDYWIGLVDEETITVTLTPIGSTPVLHSVVSTSISEVKVTSAGDINCYYVVYAERKDIKKLVVEFEEN